MNRRHAASVLQVGFIRVQVGLHVRLARVHSPKPSACQNYFKRTCSEPSQQLERSLDASGADFEPCFLRNEAAEIENVLALKIWSGGFPNMANRKLPIL